MHGILWHTSTGSQCRQLRTMPHLHIRPDDIDGLLWRALTDHKKQEHQRHEHDIDQAESIHFCSFIFIKSKLQFDHDHRIVLTFTWYEAMGNALRYCYSCLFEMSVLLSSPESRQQVVPNIVRCGHGRCSALLCSLATESRPRRYNSTTLGAEMQWYCIDLLSWMNADPFNWDQVRKQEKMLFIATWKI